MLVALTSILFYTFDNLLHMATVERTGPHIKIQEVSPRQLHISPSQLIHEAAFRNEKFKRPNEVIPIGSLVLDDGSFITDKLHVKELRDKIEADGQQLNPILVAAREKDGEVVYDMVDGAHRAEALQQLGSSTVVANVIYGLTTEELFDERIVAAVRAAGSVAPARIIDWTRRSFESSEWVDRGVSLAQIFAIAANPNSTRSYLLKSGDPEELARLKQWGRDMAGKWSRKTINMYQMFQAVENADPELVREVRASKGGLQEHKAFITIDRLAAVSMTFPGEENYALQGEILTFAIDNRLAAKETEFLALKLREAGITATTEASNLQSAMEDIKAQLPKDVAVASKRLRLEHYEHEIDRLRADVTRLTAELANVTSERDFLRRAHDVPQTDDAEELRRTVDSLRQELNSTKQSLVKTEARARRLDPVEMENHPLPNGAKGKNTNWWETADYLDLRTRSLVAILLSPERNLPGRAQRAGVTLTELGNALNRAVGLKMQHERQASDYTDLDD